MGILLIHMLKSALCLAMFYLFYRLFLSRETFHRFNRIALIGLMILSCVVPFMQISVSQAPVMSQQLTSLEELISMGNFSYETADTTVVTERNMWAFAIIILYIAGIIVFVSYEVWSIYSMWRLIRRGKVINEENGVKTVIIDNHIAPFSWLKYIVLSRQDYENPECRSILVHERAHIKLHHSYDILLADLCILAQWFNPASWLIKRELQTIHEFEADEAVISSGINAKNYQLLLIKKAVGARLYSIANSLNQSSLKKRITMMYQKKSNPWARAKYAFVLPLTAIAVVSFARPEINEELSVISSVKVSNLTSFVETTAVKSIDTPSIDAVTDTIVRQKVKGTKVEESKSRQNDEQVIRIKSNDVTTSKAYTFNANKDLSGALYFVDGEKATKEIIESLDASKIETVTVLKGQNAVDLYGEEAENGAIIIKTKK